MEYITVPIATGEDRTYKVLIEKSGLALLDCYDHYSVTHIASGRTVGPALFADKALASEVYQGLLDFPVDWEVDMEELNGDEGFMKRIYPEVRDLVSKAVDRDAALHPDRYEDEFAD